MVPIFALEYILSPLLYLFPSICSICYLVRLIIGSTPLFKMGGCQESRNTCNRTSCHGYEVDIMHFSIGNAIPGRLYGGNPIDSRDGNGGDRYMSTVVFRLTFYVICRDLFGLLNIYILFSLE
jgi:hypothetical protein